MAAAGKRDLPVAYFISGHGNEGEFKKITLPPGCTVIVKSKPGQLSISEVSAAAAKKMFCARNSIFLDPLHNLPQLVDTLGSVAVYSAGEECPNFKFKLLLTHYTSKKPGQKQKLKVAPVSGLIPIPSTHAKQAALCAAFSKPYSLISPSTEAANVLPETYIHSVMPTRAEIETMIAEYWGDEEETAGSKGSAKSGTDVVVALEDIEDDEESSLYVHLSDLLQLREDGTAGRPGIFYNFACRGAGDTDIYETKKGLHGTILIPTHGNVIPSIRTIAPGKKGDKTRKVRRLLLNAIAEAETKRKHIIRGSRKFNPRTRSRGGGRRRSRRQ